MIAGPAGSPRNVTAALLWCGAIAGPVFVATALVEGTRRVDYRQLRHPISGLSLGPRGSIQVANFFAAGTLCAAFAAGLSRANGSHAAPPLGPAMIGTIAGALIVSGIFPTDPVNGYPPGAPAEITSPGAVHLLASAPVMLGVPATAFGYARSAARAGDRAWAVYSAGTAGLTLGAFLLAGAGFAEVSGLSALPGLFQRVAVVTGFGWLAALAVRTLHRLCAS